MKACFRTESPAALVVVASLALPSGAWAQGGATVAMTDGVVGLASVVAPERPFSADTLDARRAPSLGDAMADAHRSPFHAAARAPGLATGGGEAGVTVVRIPFSSGLVPDSTGESLPFDNVFVPTLAAAFLFDMGAALLVGVCAWTYCFEDVELLTTVLVLGASAAVLGPAAVARHFGEGTWEKSILGSTVGVGLGSAAIALEMDGLVGVLTIPTIHALVTTIFGRL